MHKFKIVAAGGGQFRVQFVYNNEVLVWSENYKSKATARNCIASLKKNAPEAPVVDLADGQTGKGYRFEVVPGKKEGFFVRFVARNGDGMVISESYAAKKSALNAVESVKKNGPKADVVDEAVAERPRAKVAIANPAAVKPAIEPARNR